MDEVLRPQEFECRCKLFGKMPDNDLVEARTGRVGISPQHVGRYGVTSKLVSLLHKRCQITQLTKLHDEMYVVCRFQYVHQSNNMRVRDLAHNLDLGKEISLELALKLNMLYGFDREERVILLAHRGS